MFLDFSSINGREQTFSAVFSMTFKRKQKGTQIKKTVARTGRSCGNFAPESQKTHLSGVVSLGETRRNVANPIIPPGGNERDTQNPKGTQIKKTVIRTVFFIWCSCGNSNPGHLD